MEIFLLVPVVEKLAAVAKPCPPLPCPVIDEVAVILPVVVNALFTPIPRPPFVPPMQEENTTSPLPVKTALKLTPRLLNAAVLAMQLENVTAPVVAGVQAFVILTPLDPDVVFVLVPETVIVPEVLLITPATDPAMFTPKLGFVLPDAEPVKEMLPFPVVVETVEAPPVRLIPCEAVLLGPPVPFSVIEPPPLVLIEPPVSEIP
jgi:hypothetical protein